MRDSALFFVLSKALGFFVVPSNILVVFAVVGVLLSLTRLERAGRRLTLVSVLLLALFSFSPIGNVLIFALEQRFPAWQPAGRDPDGILVLGGAIDQNVSPTRTTLALNEAGERLTEAMVLARRYPNARVLYSGGSSRLIFADASGGELAKTFFLGHGLAPERLMIEDQSRNTFENAVLSKRLADPKPGERWLLVTSAFHMPRSVGIFRRVGFAVEPYPVDWRTRGAADDLVRPFAQASDGLQRVDLAIREWIGLVVYRMTGRSSELFPVP